MQIIFLGPPASGKGTQSALIVEKYNIPHISTGDILREAIKNQTEAGKIAEKLINDGNLVPDDVMINIVKDRLKNDDCINGYLLDGFPRTIPQAEALELITQELGHKIDIVINLVIDEKLLINRVMGRRLCKKCNATYHLQSNPPKVAGVCDVCGGELYQRKDDNEQSIAVRLEAYNKQTAPLAHYYENKGILKNIDALREISQVFEDIQKVLEK